MESQKFLPPALDDLKNWKERWDKADTDTKRVGALHLLTEVIKHSDVDENQRRAIYETIGYSFLKTLLLSDHEESLDGFFKKVSILVLSCFCTDSVMLADHNVCSFIEPINKILNEHMVPTGDEIVILEGVNCLLKMVGEERCCEQMLTCNTFCTMVNIYCRCAFVQEQAMGVLLHLISYEIHYSAQNQEMFNALLAKVSEQFADDNSAKKFELCEQILIIILKCASFSVEVETANKIRETLTLVLQNRLKKEHRDVAIKLASILIDKFDSPWFSMFITENAKKFFLVLVQLSCVEIRMLIEDKSINDIIGESFLLTACYSIFENAISTLSTEAWLQLHRNLAAQLQNSIKMAMTAALTFLKGAASECESITFNVHELSSSEQILLATIRVVCSWLAEEMFMLQEVNDVLPFLVDICKKWFQQTQISEAPTELDPLRFFLAPLCHLTAEDKSREILVSHGLFSLLLKYFEYIWKLFEEGERSLEIETALANMFSIFLNIVVFSPHPSAENDDLFNFLKLLLNILPSIGPEQLHFKAYISILGLLLAKPCHKKVKSCETSFYRFLSTSIKFLWDAHYVETQEVSLRMTQKYREVWGDVMELWFLGVHALCSLLPVMPWIANFIAESGWPTVIINALLRISPNGIAGNIKSTYQALLSTLVRISDDVAETLVQQDGILACQKHQLTELERLLSGFINRKSS